YKLKVEEGPDETGLETGDYGHYTQSARASIYQSYIKNLLQKGLAYPCFATPEELEELRSRQETLGERSGYWGHFALWRDRSQEDILAALDKGLKPVIRLKSPGNFNNKIIVNDLLIGRREMPENDQDIVIMKSDGLPTYHFAHAIDDHLMGTTHVIRGNEWFPSLPLHLQLFQILGWKAPAYAHLAPIQKLDEGKKRKLSKRKDQEANLEYYYAAGYPEEAVIEYLLNLANSNFEDWRKVNPAASYEEFPITWKKLANSNGPLFDAAKLEDISKNIVSRLDAKTVYQRSLDWAKAYDAELAVLLTADSNYSQKILNIEREGASQPRKDIGRWSETKNEISYFFDDKFSLDEAELNNLKIELKELNISAFITDFLASYNINDSQETWFDKLKIIGEKYGFTGSNKDYKANPDKYQGQVGALAKLLRLLLTGRTRTPNLCLVMQVMGEERIKERLTKKF
ncbi:MAG: glutamate--tRNA ligase family protein, partial [Patescibacteria group bacterium]|nr:glutamate--tRNA ligase family protein [Patescibacteria group bacterium]